MNRIMLAALALAAAAPAVAAERRYTVTDFDRIQVEGPFRVTLNTGKAGSAIARGSQQSLDRVSIAVQGRVLRVRSNRSGSGGYPGESTGPIEIALTTHGLRAATLTGAGSLTVDKAKTMRFDLAVSGSGSVTVGTLEADDVIIGLLGSGSISIGGKAERLRATVQGAGSLDAGALQVEHAEINSDTAGNVLAAVSGAAKVTATGPGDTRISGSPACTVKALGAGRVSCGD